jgi:hypothetical protein
VAAAEIEAGSRVQAARIYADAWQKAPELYKTLRSLDTLNGVVGSGTHLILRTDAAPFRALVDGPPGLAPAKRQRANDGGHPLPASALAQSLRLGYRLLLAITLLAGLAWLFGHVRPVPADSQAVVLHFGAIDRVQRAGLLLAGPAPSTASSGCPPRKTATTAGGGPQPQCPCAGTGWCRDIIATDGRRTGRFRISADRRRGRGAA